MKKKESREAVARQRHRDQLKKKRRTAPSLERPVAELIEKPLILIVCEGENTEPSYFNQFRLSSATVKSIGEGYERTEVLKNENQYDQVWCVFDKDDFDDNDFNTAIQKAETQDFKVAYSNQSFEYWLILHFDDHQGGGMHRNDYSDKINQLLAPFDKTKRKRIDLAISRAKRNLKQFDPHTPAKSESSTTVFKLVELLLTYS